MSKKNHTNKNEILKKITPVIEKIVSDLGLIAVEINFNKEFGKWFLRIYIYNPSEPITHKDCEKVTFGLGDYLEEIIPVNYYLEVSSPGVDRKIKNTKEYFIFKGKYVEVKLKKSVKKEGDLTPIEGKLINYSRENGLELLIENCEFINIPDEYISKVFLKPKKNNIGDKA